MASKNYLEKKIAEEFSSRESFSRAELLAFVQGFEPELSEATFGWRIFDMKKRHFLKDVRKGVYTLEQKADFKPRISDNIHGLYRNLELHDADFNYSFWSTDWLNEFLELQTTSTLSILEVDKSEVESVYYSLKGSNYAVETFLNPHQREIQYYVSELYHAVIIKPMITRAPITQVEDIYIATLEKILVDLFCDEQLFYAYQGHQLVNVFEACLSKYSINFSKLFSYAKRRKRDNALKNFLLIHPEFNLTLYDIY